MSILILVSFVSQEKGVLNTTIFRKNRSEFWLSNLNTSFRIPLVSIIGNKINIHFFADAVTIFQQIKGWNRNNDLFMSLFFFKILMLLRYKA